MAQPLCQYFLKTIRNRRWVHSGNACITDTATSWSVTPTSAHQTKSRAALHEKTKPMQSKEVDRPSTGSGQGNTIIRVPRLTFSMVNIHFMPAKASVADSAPIATCSKADLSQPNIPKLVSQAAYKSSTVVARPRPKDHSNSSIINSSNSFHHPISVAPRQDNHVAQGASRQFGSQITLVSRKSRHPAQSAQARGTKDPGDQCTTISEFASYLQTRSGDAENTNRKQKPIFRDLIMYYAAKFPGKKMSHSTKRRMEIVCYSWRYGSCTDPRGLQAFRTFGQGGR
jgi:hypothetical protein